MLKNYPKGMMQGAWLLVVGSIGWSWLKLWNLWTIFVLCGLLSAVFIFTIMRRLEKATVIPEIHKS